MSEVIEIFILFKNNKTIKGKIKEKTIFILNF